VFSIISIIVYEFKSPLIKVILLCRIDVYERKTGICVFLHTFFKSMSSEGARHCPTEGKQLLSDFGVDAKGCGKVVGSELLRSQQ